MVALFGRKGPEPNELIAQGMALVEGEHYQQAMVAFDKAIEVAPKNAMAWFCKGTLHSSLRQYEPAIPCYAKAAKLDPQRAHVALFNMARAYQELGQTDAALLYYGEVTRLDPNAADAWVNRGCVLDDAGKPAEAIACYNEALKIDPNDPDPWANRGNSLRALGRYKRALADYKKARELDPEHAPTLIGIGICLGRLGDPAKGLKFLDKGLAGVEHSPSMAERATLLAMLDRHDEALQWIDKSIKLGNTTPEAWNNRGEILARLKKPKESVASFNQALKQNPNYAPALFGKARLLLSHGYKAKAKELFDRYFKASDGSDDLADEARKLADLCDQRE